MKRLTLILMVLFLAQTAWAQPDVGTSDPDAGQAIVTTASEPEEAAADEPASTDPSVTDEAIGARLEGIFANVEELSSIDVEVRSGVVRLTGTVLSSSAAKKAEELASRQDGVVYVENAIEDERAVGERISPALKKARDVMEQFVATLPLFGVALVILVAFLLLATLATRLEFPFRRLEEKPLVKGIVKQIVWLVIFGSGFLLVLELFDLTALVGAVLGTAGVAGLAIGFAFKDIVENYLSSLMLSMRQPFEKNDVVKVGDLQGKVIRLTTRETVLMTLDGNHLRIPNSTVFKSVIINYTRNPLRRFDFVVGVGPGEDLRECVRVGNETLRATKGVLGQPKPFGVIEELADFTVNVRFYAWVDQSANGFATVNSDAIRRVKVAFDTAGIDMPEPTYRLLSADWTPPVARDVPSLEDELVEEVEEVEEDRPTEQVNDAIERERATSDEPDLLSD